MKKISRRAFIAGGGAVAAAIYTTRYTSLLKRKSGKPNIILFIADDMRHDATGYAGNAIVKTPHIDALASRSVVFTNHFVTTSICPTSRASIMTGTYANRHKVYDFKTPLRSNDWYESFAHLLRQSGYHTGFIGKWGMGGTLPKDGFDHWMGYAGQGQYYGKSKTHLTVRQTQQARQFLHDKPYGKPFLMVVSFKAPHGPWQSQKKFKALYKDVSIPRHPTDTPEAFSALPKLLQGSHGRHTYKKNIVEDRKYQEFSKDYYALISGLDEAVGEILSMLGDEVNNTAVLFTSDNGLMNGEHGLMGKFCMYESSIRTPMLVHLPGSKVTQKIDNISLNIDIAPTILSIAGMNASENMQGNNLCDIISGNSNGWRNGFYYYHPKEPVHQMGKLNNIIACSGYRGDRYKYTRYVFGKKNDEVLFDLVSDPYELHNLAVESEYAALLETMRELMKAEKQRVA